MKTLDSTPSPSRHSGLVAFALLSCGLLAALALGHDGRRIGQLLWLALPVLVWLLWPLRSPAWHRARAFAVAAWMLVFVADALTRAYLMGAYGAAPDSALVLGAAANSNVREQSEYLASQWRSMALWASPLLPCALLGWQLARRGARVSPAGSGRWTVPVLCAVLVIGGLAYASKSWRRLHPVVFWSGWAQSALELRAGWADQHRTRAAALALARSTSPTLATPGPSTVVWVISDSVNRDNMSLYGYDRPTTPLLRAQRAEVGSQMVVLRNAWSTEASTLPALDEMFGFGLPEGGASPRATRQVPPHVLALARAAGYKVWWMSNHDDIAVEQQHAGFADVVEMINRTPGRSGTSLDGELLDDLQEALEDPAERKLVVVHLLGAHPHYDLRFPPRDNPFDDEVDGVERELIARGRSSWVRKSRQAYDAAMLYHDSVVARTLQLTRTAGRAGEERAWMYLSDHGQEVGHDADRTGHSPATASGYRIPAIVWRNRAPDRGTGGGAAAPAALEQRPFRSDWIGWTMADLMGIRWPGASEARNVLSPGYVWEPPALQARVESFSR